MIVLYESKLKARLFPVGAIVHLREKPTRVAVLLRRYDLDRWDSSLFYLHCGPPSLHPTSPDAALLPEAAATGPLKSSSLRSGAVGRPQHAAPPWGRANRERRERPEITVPGHLPSDVFLGANLLNFLSKGVR